MEALASINQLGMVELENDFLMTIDGGRNLTGVVGGAAAVVAGVAGIVGGAAALAAPEPTGATKVGGYAAIVGGGATVVGGVAAIKENW